MYLEIQSAANLLMHIVRLGRVPEDEIDEFGRNLVASMRRRYRDHWDPTIPRKGSGYRVISFGDRIHPIIAQAADGCMSPWLIYRTLPTLTLWIDPFEVSYRIGENGCISILYDGGAQPWTPNDTFRPKQHNWFFARNYG